MLGTRRLLCSLLLYGGVQWDLCWGTGSSLIPLIRFGIFLPGSPNIEQTSATASPRQLPSLNPGGGSVAWGFASPSRAVADGFEGDEDGAVVVGGVGGELVRHICGRHVAADEGGRDASVEYAVVHCRFEGGGEVRHLGVKLVVGVLVGLLKFGGAVISRGLGATLHQLV